VVRSERHRVDDSRHQVSATIVTPANPTITLTPSYSVTDHCAGKRDRPVRPVTNTVRGKGDRKCRECLAYSPGCRLCAAWS
jgi:hypothetical protein